MKQSDGSLQSRSVEDFLKAVYLVEQRRGQASTGAVAEKLTIAPASVTEMTRRLAGAGLVTFQKYRGMQLTAAGTQAALHVIRRHRLLELYLARMLHYGLHEVHEEADHLEHVVSDRFIAAVAQTLGEPQFDPHGDFIPTATGHIVSRTLVPLPCLPSGTCGVIAQVIDQRPDVLRYLTTLGLLPGVPVTVKHQSPLGDLVSIQSRSTEACYTLSTRIAETILVTKP